jgi:hypothetical protein
MSPLASESAAAEVGVLTVSPGAIKHEMETVDAAVRQLDAEVRPSLVALEFVKAWDAFLSEWRRFFADHQRWVDRLYDATYFKTLEFRRRLSTWREAFIKAGGKPHAPALPGQAVTAFPWERLAVVVGGATVVVGILSLVSSIADTRGDR